MGPHRHLDMSQARHVLIIGIAGGLARITAGLLLKRYPGLRITGVDARAPRDKAPLRGVEHITMRYTRSSFEKLFRAQEFDAVLHLGRMGHISFNGNKDLKKRLDLNVVGTGRILELAHKFGVKKVVILGTYHVYGALPDNQAFLTEEAPLRASIKYPELRDVVEMDQVATNNVWKYQNELESVVLRPCSIIGPQIRNAMTTYLLSSLAPSPLDYNPMFQFVHESDMASIIVRCLQKAPTGIYNVAPDDLIPIVEAKKLINPTGPRLPISLLDLWAHSILRRTFLFKIPRYMLDYVRYPCLISNQCLKHALGEQNPFRYGSQEAVELLRLSSS